MSVPLTLACIWVLAATGVALMPYRRQMVPGLALLIAAPVLIGWIGWEHGWLWAVVALLAFGSMFRRPLIYFGRRALGLPVETVREQNQ